MVFRKPVSELTFADIQALVDSEEPESITLEYKRQIDTSQGGKKELAKDVSAMANSQGGHLIIGLAEEDHRPMMPEGFVGRMLGKQKVEEWLDQVLNSNIQQRVNVRIKPIPVAEKPEECVVVMHVPPSPRVPHMVTAQNDNRYYVRHNFEVLPAEECEVNDMYHRRSTIRAEVEAYLARQGYSDPDSPDFGHNSASSKTVLIYSDDCGNRVVKAVHALVSFIACPALLGEYVDTQDDAFRDWVHSSTQDYYPGGPFLPQMRPRYTLQGLIYLQAISAGGQREVLAAPHSRGRRPGLTLVLTTACACWLWALASRRPSALGRHCAPRTPAPPWPGC